MRTLQRTTPQPPPIDPQGFDSPGTDSHDSPYGVPVRRKTSRLAGTQAPVGLDACWVADGRLLAGAHPGAGPYAVGDRLDVLLEAGVRHFVDLTLPGEGVEYAWELDLRADALGEIVTYARHPLPRRRLPTAATTVTAVLDRLDDCLLADGITYLHGRDPMRRPGLVVGCRMVRRGQSPDVALNWLETRNWRNGGRLETRPLSREQQDFVRAWMPRS
jgi:hypothetical protein